MILTFFSLLVNQMIKLDLEFPQRKVQIHGLYHKAQLIIYI